MIQERRVFSLIEDVLNNVVMKVQLDDKITPDPSTAVAHFIDKLRQKPNMVFTSPNKRNPLQDAQGAVKEDDEEDTLPMNVEE